MVAELWLDDGGYNKESDGYSRGSRPLARCTLSRTRRAPRASSRTSTWLGVMMLALTTVLLFVPVGAPDVVDTKLIGRPPKYDGSDSGWQDWKFVFLAYCQLLSPVMARSMVSAAGFQNEVPMASVEEEREAQEQLYWLLAMLVTGCALAEVRMTNPGNGFEAWRRLCMRYEPKTRNRQLGLLDAALHPNLTGEDYTVLDKINEWEQMIRKYDSIVQTAMSDDIKIATLMKGVSEKLRAYLMQLMTQSGSNDMTYRQVRESVERYFSSQRAWSGEAPMDIGALKGYSKGKDGKGKYKGSGKGYSDVAKGKDFVKGKQKGFKGKSKDSGKGKESKRFEGVCHYCGKAGHKEVDCWKKQDHGYSGKGGWSAAVVSTSPAPHPSPAPSLTGSATSTPKKTTGAQDLLQTVSALHTVGENEQEDDVSWIFGLQEVPQGNVCEALTSHGDSGWVLLDSGSMIHACSKELAADLGTEESVSRGKFQTVTGAQIGHYGKRVVPLILGDDERVPTRIGFEVTDVKYPVVSLGKVLTSGAKLMVSGDGGFLEKDGHRADVKVKDNVLMVKATRSGATQPVLVAPVEHDEQDGGPYGYFNRMMEPFDAVAPRLPEEDEDVAQEALEVIEGDVQEVEPPRARDARRPGLPTEEQYNEHVLTHASYEPWCMHCVSGRGREDAHRRRPLVDRTENVVAFDYCYTAGLNDEGQDPKATILVGVDTDTGSSFSCVCRSKGRTDKYVMKAVCRWITSLGCTRAVLQTDGEASIVDLMRAVKQQLSIPAQLRQSPVDDPQSNGAAERQVGLVKGLLKTHLAALQVKYETTILRDHWIFPWAVRHVSWIMTRFVARGADKRSSYAITHGYEYKGELTEFGEVVMAKLLQKGAIAKSGAKWVKGVMCGKAEETDSWLIATREGIAVARTIRRLPMEDAWDVMVLRRCRGLPWAPKPDDDEIGPQMVADGRPDDDRRGDDQKRDQRVVRGGVIERAAPAAASGDGADQHRQEDGGVGPKVDSDVDVGDLFSPETSRDVEVVTQGQKRGRDEDDDEDAGRGDPQPSASSAGVGAVQLEHPHQKNIEDTWFEPDGITDEEREAARGKEIEQMRRFGVMSEVDVDETRGHRVISTTWVDKRKSPEVVKSRLCARDYNTRDDVFAATPSAASGRIIDYLSVRTGFGVRSADVSGAFLHTPVPAGEKIFIKPPDDYQPEQIPKGRCMWQLQKMLYGLRDAPAAWQQHLALELVGMGFDRGTFEPSLFHHTARQLYVLIHVDDLHMCGPESDMEWLCEKLRELFVIKVSRTYGVNDSYEFLRARRHVLEDGVLIVPDERYIEQTLEDMHLTQARPAATPAPIVKTTTDDEDELNVEQKATYRTSVGRLLYLSHWRFDVQWTIRLLASGMQDPRVKHWRMLKHMLRYLK